MRNYWWQVSLAYLCVVLSTALNAVVPWLMKEVIDRGVIGRDMGFITLVAFMVIGINLIRGVLHFGQGYLVTYFSQRVAFDLRNTFYNHVQRLSFSYHDKAQTGDLMARATGDVDAVTMFFGSGLTNIFSGTLVFITSFTVLFNMEWRLSLVCLAAFGLLAVTAANFSRIIGPPYSRVQQQYSVVSSVLQENLAGARVVKSFAREEHEIEKFRRETRELLARNIRVVRLYAFNLPFSAVSALGITAILWFGGTQVAAGHISIGTLVAFTGYFAMLGGPASIMGSTMNVLVRTVASGERLFQILDTRSAVQEKHRPIKLPTIRGHVRFDNVHFSYDSSNPTLRDVSFEARPGETIALLGPAGSGKSTIVSLIPRLYDVTSGAVTVDGYDVRDLELSSLRKQIGIVLQDTFLFSATIRENIAYGRPDATMEDVVAAAKAACAHDFIASFSEGYETRVGERGVTLSGGQRQRVAIARALLLNPRILILDDSTSSVDAETEHLIQQALAWLQRGRTNFVIAQRLTTVKNADLILVLDKGAIVQRGTHEELLRQGGLYKLIYNLQLRDQEEMRERERVALATTEGTLGS